MDIASTSLWRKIARLKGEWVGAVVFLLKHDPEMQVLFNIAACEGIQCSEYVFYHGLWVVVHSPV